MRPKKTLRSQERERGVRRVLVIDDEPPIARLIESALQAANIEHRLDYCGDGAQGRAKAAQTRYDLITLDLHMPLMGGVEALREMKQNPKSAQTPVVVITAQQDPVFHRRVMGFGAAALVTKPFELSELGLILSRVLAGECVQPPTVAEEDRDIRPLDG